MKIESEMFGAKGVNAKVEITSGLPQNTPPTATVEVLGFGMSLERAMELRENLDAAICYSRHRMNTLTRETC